MEDVLARNPTLLWYVLKICQTFVTNPSAFTAVKCNPDPYVLRLLAALGAGFDCASNGEISQVLNIGGIHPDRVIFANPCKAVSFVRSAAKMGVDVMTFDNADELYKIARSHPRAKLVVRILTDDSKSLCQLGIKFGANISLVPSLLSKAKELQLNVVGVSFHVGSGCYDPSVYSDAIARARTVFDMGKEVGYNFDLLDVGGGFEDTLFEDAAKNVMEAIDRHFPDRGHIKIIAEPGRFYVSKAFSLATNIIARRAPFSDDDIPTTMEDEASAQQPTIMC
jgi:ornithine decarboxylase